ncbi:response regulator [Chitiniphilus eburneus]|uniref:Response regulator n=1 Tax=Chitiniphilus eburneus TaxID=2571148 RepID=A0A4U0PUA7_9NEIS|nr:response regulator [Chitiniphilus eburneus]TJZ72031.1 response regulator [Chitiniphilus eburneus]
MKRKVLIVEDNPDMLDCIAEELRYLGHDALLANGVPDALAHLANEPDIDLLLADLQLRAELNGEALARHALTMQPRLQVVIMSGFDASYLSEDGRQRFTLLRKPYSLEELNRVLSPAVPTP